MDSSQHFHESQTLINGPWDGHSIRNGLCSAGNAQLDVLLGTDQAGYRLLFPRLAEHCMFQSLVACICSPPSAEVVALDN